MARLAQTAGLTEIQQEILSTVKTFVDKEIIPHANALEHADEYPQDIVDGMKEMGLFGLTIPEEYGGLGESLLTYALVVEQIARGWMSVSGVINTHFIVAYMLTQHGTDEQKQKYLPKMAEGEVRGSFSMSEPDLGCDVAAIKTRAVADGDGYRDRRRQDVADQRRHVEPDGGARQAPTRARRSRTRTSPASWSRSPPATARSRPGSIVPGKIDKMGYKGVDTTELVFDGYRIARRADPRRRSAAAGSPR